jgi:hypothetical protein
MASNVSQLEISISSIASSQKEKYQFLLNCQEKKRKNFIVPMIL